METIKKSSEVKATEKIMRKCIVGYSEKLELTPKDIRILISCKDKDEKGEEVKGFEPKFSILPNKKVSDIFEISFEQVCMGGKRDLLGFSKLAELVSMPYFKSVLESAITDFKIEKLNLNIMIATNDDNCENIFIFIYDKFNPIKQVGFEYIFGENDKEE